MTVDELKGALAALPPNAPVMFMDGECGLFFVRKVMPMGEPQPEVVLLVGKPILPPMVKSGKREDF